MTVAELIAALQAFPADARVVTNGYEAGFDDLLPPCLAAIRTDVHGESQWFYGPHDDPEEASEAGVDQMVFIGTRRRPESLPEVIVADPHGTVPLAERKR